ncbi:Ficolin-1 [Holothuria leucospilota]|uniref:Ficolin-1 n=1 Tax=Holothuria leucospilota TaxID=206669 RepID=A0A9Q1BVC6_HOLLE|nr:Ficolin-1 [Holothuria leucospilota]
MALSTHRYIFLLVIAVCCMSLDNLSAEGTIQSPSDSAIEGQGSSFFFYQKPEYPRDCSEVRDSCSSSLSSGVYLIKPDGYEEPFEAYCDNDMDSGGWTVILRRFNDSLGFNRDWDDYKKGFGFLSREFWLGHDKIAHLTNQAEYELQINITFDNGTSCDLKYDAFRISDEWSNYTISSVGTYESDSACRWREQDNPSECDTTFKDCDEVWDNNYNNRQDGIYCIRPEGWTDPPFKVRCNMTIDGGRWTVFQRRIDGITDFYRTWDEYKEGFGDLEHDFWLGNEKLHYITQQATYEYRIDYVHSSSSYYNKYTNFRVDNEANKYRLANTGTRTGSRGYSLHQIQNTPFSTPDEDNDGRSYDCAERHRSGWWHGAYFYTYSSSYCECFQSGSTHVTCAYANPNGDYNGGNGENIYEDNYDNCYQTFTELKIRRVR